MDTRAGIPESASQKPPPPSRGQGLSGRGADGSELELLSIDVCKINNTDECWCMVVVDAY